MTDNLRVALFVSRNKDNAHIEGFRERRVPFLTSKNDRELMEDFKFFVEKGLSGETARLYRSVNRRDNDKIRKALLHYLIDNEDTDMSNLTGRIASIASLKENASEKKWLFDFDEKGELLDEFHKDLDECLPKEVDCESYKTMNNYAVIVERGFDTRELLDKWKNVELKRDDLLLIDWETKE